MQKHDGKLRVFLLRIIKWLSLTAQSMFAPAVSVGDKKRVRPKGEEGGEEAELHNLNKTWRRMLRDDPWMKKLMTHVSLLTTAMGIFFLMLWIGGLYLPAKHPVFNFVCAGILATLPYWIWVGKWNNRIERKVFEVFKKRFGKHHHLK